MESTIRTLDLSFTSLRLHLCWTSFHSWDRVRDNVAECSQADLRRVNLLFSSPDPNSTCCRTRTRLPLCL